MTRPGLLLLAARLASAIATFVVMAAIGRTLGPEVLGAVAVGTAVGFLVTAASELGTTSLLTREVSRRPTAAAGLIGTVLVLRAVILPIALIAAGIVVGSLAPVNAALIMAVALSLPLQQLPEIPRAVLLARGRFALLAGYVLVENVLWSLAIIAGLASGNLVAGFTLGAAVLAFSGLVGVVGLALSGVRPMWPGRVDARHFIRLALPFAAFSVVTALAVRLDPILISLLAPGDALVATGAYFAAMRLVAAFEYVPEATARSMYPALSRAAHEAPRQFTSLLHPASRTMLAFGIPAPFAAAALGGWVMGLVYGSEFRAFGWLAFLVAIAVPFRFMTILLGVSLTASDAHARRVWLTCAALALSVGISVVLLPRIGVAGAAVAWIASSAFLAVTYVQEVGRRFGRLPVIADSLRALAVGAGGWAAAEVMLLVLPAGPAEPIAAVALALTSGALLLVLGLVQLPRRARPVAAAASDADDRSLDPDEAGR